ncbi:MAG TPA: secretin N-terminal domain-containing protein [Sedimentisphaerales bacterium]|nr:secretin N-terminal domain-containing protein [Sedimentisphaerales bacterium]HRS10025.1 secretin N-terminal domain-containing protein [Sedimentisphaerales bacterium]HRV46731.1 secretin N-terminal domain-containing protein [Sedimentisphaerales bacterium]
MQIVRMILVGAVLAGVLLLTPGPGGAQPPSEASGATEPVEVVPSNGDVKIKLNFQDTPLQAVLEYLSEKAGLTVISEEPISNGRMTVISRQPISLDHALSLINSILKERDLTTILVGKTLKVVSLTNAKQETVPVRTGRDPNAVMPSDNVITYVIPVSHVTATALKENLTPLVPSYASIEANEDGNALIVTDTAANIRRLMEIIQALDTHMSTVAEIRVFRLVNADATSTATLINTMFQQQSSSSSRSGARNPFEMMMQMRGGPGGFGGRGGRGGDAGGGGGNAQQAGGGATVNVQVVAAADERTNAVVVRGPAEILELVDGVITSLDDRTAKVASVRVFQLRYADAMNTADVINKLFGGDQSSSQSGQGGPMMFRGPFGRGGGPEMQQDTTGGTVSQVVAAADSQTNTVVVTGPDDLLEVVADVVKNLDALVPNVADVKVFHLEYADAQDTAELINEVFGESGTSSRRTSSRNQQNQQVQFQRGGPGGFPGMQQQTTSRGSTVSDVTVIAAADSRTNSVVVSGPPETLATIAQIIKDLDENPEQERRIFVYPLKNATASNLMEVLNNLFAEIQALNQASTSGTGQQFQGGGRQTAAPQAASASSTSSNSNDLSEDTYFEAETETNSLLILTSTKNYEKIKPIIEELDKPVGQVLIKCLFAEITYSNNVDFGTEFSMLNLRSDGGSTQTSTVFGEPLQGLFVNNISGDLDVTLHALQESGKLNILSRPYILTSNNQAATITVGSQVPFATGETTSNVGTQTTTEYRDIGIILEVTPSINPDGLVNMTVRPEISSQSGDTVQISEKLDLPVFTTRSSETKVAVRDGQTIVIGGLIQDEIRDTIKKVPLLGDVPVLGHLFKRTEKEKAKTELLIFLTPHVAPDALALTPISDAVRARSNLKNDQRTAELFRQHMEAMEETPSDPNRP